MLSIRTKGSFNKGLDVLGFSLITTNSSVYLHDYVLKLYDHAEDYISKC
jgi:hypothetical protein